MLTRLTGAPSLGWGLRAGFGRSKRRMRKRRRRKGRRRRKTRYGLADIALWVIG